MGFLFVGFRRVWLVGLLVLLAAGTGQAQDRSLTVMGGYQFGGEFEDEATGDEVELDETPNFTVLLNLPYELDTEFEYVFSRQATSLQASGQFSGDELFDLDVYYLHVGGIALVNPDRVEPYVSGSLGLTHMRPSDSGLDSETRFSLSLGGGVRVPLGERLALRFDLRGFVTMLNGGGSLFCTDGNCNVRIVSDGFLQYAASAGIAFRF